MLASRSTRRPLLALLLATAALGGCRSMGDIMRAKERGEGKTLLHAASCDVAYELGREIFRDEGDAIEDHRDEGYMLSTSGLSAASYGTLMGAWFEPEKDECAVTVITKRKLATTVGTSLTEDTFHRRLFDLIDKKGAAAKSKPAAAPAASSALTRKPEASASDAAAEKPAPKKKAKKATTKKTTTKDSTGKDAGKDALTKKSVTKKKAATPTKAPSAGAAPAAEAKPPAPDSTGAAK
jgi:hypothetical protein